MSTPMTEEEKAAKRAKHAAYMKEWYAKKGRKRNKKQAAEYANAYRKKNPEAVRARIRKWKEENREYTREYRRSRYSNEEYREWRARKIAEDPEYFNKLNAATRNKPGYKERTRALRLKAKYGLTTEQYDAMVSAQGGVCRICGNPETRIIHGRDPVLSVDHCHKTGKVRDLLCTKCNTLVGHAEKIDGLVEKIAEYLKRHAE